jgi:hypothetical protein
MVPSVDVLGRLTRALGLDESTTREVRDPLVAVETAPGGVECAGGEAPTGSPRR